MACFCLESWLAIWLPLPWYCSFLGCTANHATYITTSFILFFLQYGVVSIKRCVMVVLTLTELCSCIPVYFKFTAMLHSWNWMLSFTISSTNVAWFINTCFRSLTYFWMALIQEINLFYNVQNLLPLLFPARVLALCIFSMGDISCLSKDLKCWRFLGCSNLIFKTVMTFIQAFHIHNQFYKDWKLFCWQ